MREVNAIERSRMRRYMELRVERFTKSMGSEEAGKQVQSPL